MSTRRQIGRRCWTRRRREGDRCSFMILATGILIFTNSPGALSAERAARTRPAGEFPSHASSYVQDLPGQRYWGLPAGEASRRSRTAGGESSS